MWVWTLAVTSLLDTCTIPPPPRRCMASQERWLTSASVRALYSIPQPVIEVGGIRERRFPQLPIGPFLYHHVRRRARSAVLHPVRSKLPPHPHILLQGMSTPACRFSSTTAMPCSWSAWLFLASSVAAESYVALSLLMR